MPFLVRVFFFIADLFFLNLAIYISYLAHFSIGDNANRIYLIIYSSLAWLFLVLVSSPYNVTKDWTVSKIAKSQFVFLFIHLLVVASLVIFFRRSYTLFQIGTIYLVFIPIFFISKIAIFYIKRIQASTIIRNYIIVGKNELSYEVRKYFLMNPLEGFKFLGYFDYVTNNLPIEKIRNFCENNEVHFIYCCAPNVDKQALSDLVNFGLDSLINVKLVVNSGVDANRVIQLDENEQRQAQDIATIPLDEVRNQFSKRVFDLVFSCAFSLLVLSWLIPMIALLIKMDSRGPVFFVQKRNGRKNAPFGCIKFRTMIVNQESDTKQATKDDSRITRVGKFLRRSSLDEFPQFFNVVLGDMSLIGPRPHPIKLNEEFASRITNIMARHYVKPGITGLAQCMGYRGETRTLTDMENRVRLDRYYIENWTFWLDIKIIFLTIVSLLRGSEKAY
jgi:putative colanic acid biosysnthesis UDP-glucose lipid carrier transferase